jgi:hypothetical protein
MWMDFYMAGINKQPFIVWLVNERLKHFFPSSFVSPATKPPVCIFPVAIVRGKVSPGGSRSKNPKNSIYKESVILGNTPPHARLAGEKRLQKHPGCI